MPFSSVLGASTIIKPGVCTSTNRPTTPYDGQVIYETDTDRTLVYNGTGWVFLSTSRANPGGLDLIKTQTIGSAVSSVTVSDVFSSTYDNYLIQVSGGAASTSNWGNLTLGSTNTGYYWYEMFANYSATTLSGANAQNTTSFRDAVGGTTDSVMGEFALYAPNLAKNTHFKTSVSTARTAGEVVFNSGYLANTTQYTAFTLTTGSGTWTGGTIAVYGYAK